MKLRLGALALVIAILAIFSPIAGAQETETTDKPAASSAGDLSSPVKIVLVMTLMALAPAILMTMTSFTRIVIVLSFVRRALAIQELPPNQVVVGLSLFLTLLSMNPVWTDVWRDSVRPYLDEKVTLAEAGEKAGARMKTFLIQHAGEEEIQLFLELSEAGVPDTPQDVSLTVLIPAFALSELKIAFKMGFLIFIPFLIVDIVVAGILMAMGMFMLPPVIISTPFKILLFILVDGWTLVIRSLMQSFEVVV